ncbi:MAG: TIGR04283 family arsenosugar biosynthesis glycosyltransferase [Gammaproteobacteria bacterium]|nr:TIGR04283 family arsenosugar biosynthesis glycosyltransferase [Gammaproteobacteria bacterium]
MSKIAVIIPVLNDRDHLSRLLTTLLRYPDLELIVVDGGSSDNPHEISNRVTFIQATKPGRGMQVALGIKHATREWLWVLHADSLVHDENVENIDAVTTISQVWWGRFDVSLDGSRWEFRMIETLMNLRSRLTSICTGDQGMFFHRDILKEIGGFPDQPLMEDVEVSKRLRQVAKPFCSKSRLGTSIRKWEADGVFRTMFRMWIFRIRYYFGVSPDALYSEYYRHR